MRADVVFPSIEPASDRLISRLNHEAHACEKARRA
jgi:hypothetical protein